MNNNFDVIVIGNGSLAYSTVFNLFQENNNIKIALIAPKNKLACASLSAGAMLNSFAEVDSDTLKCKYLKYKFDLNRKSASLWKDWAKKLNHEAGSEILKLQYGTYIINNSSTDAFDDENYEAIVNTLTFYNENYQEVNPKEIKGLSADSRNRALKAIYIPNEGFMKSPSLATVYEAIFSKKQNVQIIDDSIIKINIDDNGNKIAIGESENTYSSNHIVIAAGAKSQEIISSIPEIANKIPRLFYGVGSSLVVESENIAPEKVIRTPNRGLACGIHLVPYSKNITYIGATNFISPIPEYSPRMSAIQALMTNVIEQINTKLYKAQVKKVLIGHRPTTADTFPLIGETSIKGLWILSGTKRDGLHMSPLYGKYISDGINKKTPDFENWFSPERELIHTMTKEEGITKAIKHLKSAAYQHELELPKIGWEDFLNESLRMKIEKIYNTCGVKDFGIPAEMLDMYKYGHVKFQNPKLVIA